jgi:hypothetical protein
MNNFLLILKNLANQFFAYFRGYINKKCHRSLGLRENVVHEDFDR